MKTTSACSPRVHVQAVVSFIMHNFQNVRMAAYKKLRWFGLHDLSHRRRIIAGITTYVCYQYIHVFTPKPQKFMKLIADICSVDIAEYSS